MISQVTRRLARWCVVLAMTVAAGCGGISRDKVDDADVSRTTYKVRSGRTVLVVLGSVTAREELPADVRDPVARYLRDGAKSALAQHDIFKVVTATSTATNLLERFMAADGGKKQILDADADLDVEMEEVKEHMGATVKVGLISSQKKYATAVVRVSLRLRNGGKVYEVRERGRSSQGAGHGHSVWEQRPQSVSTISVRLRDMLVPNGAGDGSVTGQRPVAFPI